MVNSFIFVELCWICRKSGMVYIGWFVWFTIPFTSIILHRNCPGARLQYGLYIWNKLLTTQRFPIYFILIFIWHTLWRIDRVLYDSQLDVWKTSLDVGEKHLVTWEYFITSFNATSKKHQRAITKTRIMFLTIWLLFF